MTGLVHLRLVVPEDLADQVRGLLVDHECATNVVVLTGAARKPAGDVVEADVAREAASSVLDDLAATGLPDRGGIVVSEPTDTPFAAARELDRAAPGDPDDAVIWSAVLDDAEAASRPTITYLAFLVLATVLASIAVITDSSVLVVGAMVVGPEFVSVAAVCVGLVMGRWSLAARSLLLLVAGFAAAIALVTVLALLAVATGFVSDDMVTRPRPLTGFIWHPDRWSFVVALVAGAAGVLAVATRKSSTMVGVFISVTTVPAAGNLALGLAIGDRSEIVGSATQLSVNIVGMVLAGIVTVAALKLARARVARLGPPVGGR
ncbi:DUF389 domain-containing protein [Luteipulveratus sp. YIM 133132]|uniref:DUF389 domain-containing protein n=1 Tax=Luteipulveratus flavus TaxID=3031728 RepID=UPI0023B1459D|nr:DUF389 domain-containing protein [Luteipulveratus sp. YIM 133132]MDE9365319.1 DUF389 domain-containing protein [Luteipulveratus sp. YIM 133132]